MISFHHERMLRWYYGPGQALFEKSPIAGMIERHGAFNAQAVMAAGHEYGMPGRSLCEDDDGVMRMRDTRDPIYSKGGAIIGYHPAETVRITAETRAAAGYTPDEKALEDYGEYAGLTLKLGRASRVHGAAFESYFGELGEQYANGVLVEKGEKPKTKAEAKPVLSMGIESKSVPTDPEMVVRKGPGRIASLYHLTASGQALLEAHARSVAARGGEGLLKPHMVIRAILVQSGLSKDTKAAIERMRAESLLMLAAACAAWNAIAEEEAA